MTKALRLTSCHSSIMKGVTMENLKRLREIVLEKSFMYNEDSPFRLSSGLLSPFYFDCKKTTLDPEGSCLIGELLFEFVKQWPIMGAGGLTLGADPLGGALMYAAWKHKRKINQFIVRKQLKSHGAIKWVEGNIQRGDSVVILDDVITTGNSVIEAIDHAREDGLNVFGVLVLVDRQEFDGMNKIKKLVPNGSVTALINRTEIMDIYNEITKSTPKNLHHLECCRACNG